ncbi:MAG: metallophosphoesterase, partial [Actinomycetales bacterium]
MRTPNGRSVLLAGALGCAAGLGALAYAHWESRRFTVRRFEIAVLPAGQPPLRLLHLSDLHMLPGQRDKAAWVASLVELRPDAVIATGDFLSHRDAVPAALGALGPLLDLPG